MGGTLESFTWDEAETPSPLLVDATPSGTTYFVYGPGSAPLEQISSSGVVVYFTHDQLGSTRVLTDQTGVVAATFTYDAYGNLTGSTGSATTPLLYAGEYRDAESGLYYLRARYYDPSNGSFLSRDPATSRTLAPYAYGGDSPLNQTDPSGRIDKSALSQAQIDQINQQCAAWQNQSLCTQAAFCAESTYGLGSMSGGSCRQIAQIAANDYAIIERALASVGPCDPVPLEDGYMATHAEAERDLAEAKAAFEVAVESLNYYNADNECKQHFAIGGVIATTALGLAIPAGAAIGAAGAAESFGEAFNSLGEGASAAQSSAASGLIGGLIMSSAC